MEPKINSDKGEGGAKVTPYGKHILFGRNIDPKTHNANIYWVDAQIIEELRPKE